LTEHAEMVAALEAILFVTSEPVPREKLIEVFEGVDEEASAAAMDEVVKRYGEDAGRGVVLEEVAGGLRLITRPELNGYLRKFFEVTGRTKLSMAALETLAIVGYRQPISGPEIQELRGVASGGVLRTLLERRLIRVAGRKPVVGKPFLYRTTRDFLMHFGLESIDDLPPLEEFEERFGVLGELPEQLDLSGRDASAEPSDESGEESETSAANDTTTDAANDTESIDDPGREESDPRIVESETETVISEAGDSEAIHEEQEPEDDGE